MELFTCQVSLCTQQRTTTLSFKLQSHIQLEILLAFPFMPQAHTGIKRFFLFQFALQPWFFSCAFIYALNLAAARSFSLSFLLCFPCAILAPDSNLDLNALELTLHQFKRLADPFFRRQNKPSSFSLFRFWLQKKGYKRREPRESRKAECSSLT